MADDRRQFALAVSWREALLESDALSVPADMGKVAILCSHPLGEYGDEARNKGERNDARVFRKEAQALVRFFAQTGKQAEIVYDPTYEDMQNVIKDPRFSDIITIGNGCLSAFYFDTDRAEDPPEYDWFNAIVDAEHLKTGIFMQRHCGHYSRNLNVPIGTFVMSSSEGVIAPAGHYFNARGLYHPEKTYMHQPIVDLPLEYEHPKQRFPKHEYSKS